MVTNYIRLIAMAQINQNLKLIFCVKFSFTLIILFNAKK